MISERTVMCIRGGFANEAFLVEDTQAGDLVVVKQGIELPGDGVLLRGFSVVVDESSMTGETKHMSKEPLEKCLQKKLELEARGVQSLSHSSVPSPVVLSGTKVVGGTGVMLVINVGQNSAIGRIQQFLSSGSNEMTPLQLKLERIARNIGFFGLACALIIFICVVIRSLVGGG